MALTRAASAGGIKWDTLKGALLLFTPKSVETDIKTVHGTASAVKADVVVLDGPEAPATYIDTLVFPKVLQAGISGAIGSQVLGRLAQGVAKPGQSAPWVLEDASDDAAAVKLATPHLLPDEEETALPF